MRRILAVAAVVLGTIAVVGPAARVAGAVAPRSVMYIGNNWDGTADVVDASTLHKIKRLDMIPDKAQRLAEIYASPDKLAFFLLIRQEIGEGHDQYTDDVFSSHDGKMVAVSRPSFADVVGIDTATNQILWRYPMEGYRADHMAESPDGTRLLVSDSTANKVHELDLATGRHLRDFASGDTPHESNYSKDGTRIFHASIGRIYTPTDPSMFCPLTDPLKGDQRFQIVDNATFQIIAKWDMGERLKAAGFPCMSSAVRPMAVAPDEKHVYLQVSFFHGFVDFDLTTGTVRRVVPLPDLTNGMPKSQYVLNSAHHGIAINATGGKLCVAGTMDGYAAIVNTATAGYRLITGIDKPYWATDGPGATRCWMSASGSDSVYVIDYASERVLAQIPVGDHPQRIRAGYLAG